MQVANYVDRDEIVKLVTVFVLQGLHQKPESNLFLQYKIWETLNTFYNTL
jgi:hypothetical protein